MGTPAAGTVQGSQDAGSAPVPPGFAALLQLGTAVGPTAGTTPQPSDAASTNAGGPLLQTGRMRVRPTKETTDNLPGTAFATLPPVPPQLPIAVAPSSLGTAPSRMSADATSGLATEVNGGFSATNLPKPPFITLAAPAGTPAAAGASQPTTNSATPSATVDPAGAAIPAGLEIPSSLAIPAGLEIPDGNAAQSQAESATLPVVPDAQPPAASTTTSTSVGGATLTAAVGPEAQQIPSPSGAISLPPVVGSASQDVAKSGPQLVTTRSAATTLRQSASESTPVSTPLAQAASTRLPAAPPAPVGPQAPDLKAATAPAESRAQAPGQTTSTTGIAPATAETPSPVSLADTSVAANGASFTPIPGGGFATVQNSSTGSSSDGSPQGDGNSAGQMVERADRKSRPGEMQPAAGDGARVGMGGWVASAPAHEAATSSHAEANTPVASSGGMAQMAVDRTASDSSARRLNNALQSDMGVQTDAFGRVHIQTSVTGRDLSAQISLEHMHAGSSGLAAQMPALEDALREKYNMAASVNVRPDAGSTAGNAAGHGQSRQGDQTPQTPVPYAVAPLVSGLQTLSTSPSGRASGAWSGSQSSGRLDITI
ncbi:MAG: hypothetical protein ACRYF4_11530 [Janthinobacterium lividum]